MTNFKWLQNRKNLSLPDSNIIVYGGQVEGHVSFESLLSRGWVTEAVTVDPGKDVCILLSSSGTTGLPKHVMLTHRNILANLPQTE